MRLTERFRQWVEELWTDVRLALRQLRGAPTFTAVAVVTLALGVGANSAIFALVDATLLRPLPFPAPDRLVMLWERSGDTARGRVSPANLVDWSDRNRTFQRVAGFAPGVGAMVMSGQGGTAESVARQWVTDGFFDVLGVRPIAGRAFLPSDSSQQANVVVLSEPFWRSRFNADPSVVGRSIRFDGEPYTVVGVVPAESQLFGRTSIWALVAVASRPELRSVFFLQSVGRLRPGVTLDAARSDMTAVADGLARELPQTNRGRGVTVEPLHDAIIGSELRLTSMLFLGVVGFVLLICCANVANLLLARATARTRELQVRSALGAGRGRVIRHLVTESLVLAVIGGACGLGVGALILSAAPAVLPEDLLPAAVTLGFDARVMSFGAGAALLVGLLFGIGPAWQATGLALVRVASAESRTVTSRGGGLRRALVAGEIAAAVLLLVGAGLLLRTLLAVDRVERGYRAEGVLTMYVDPLGSRYPTQASLLQFFDSVTKEIAGLPVVDGVAWASTLPLGASAAGRTFFSLEGQPPFDPNQRPTADYQIVSASYFETLDLPLVDGRAFDDRDTRDTVPVCIVNEAFVREHLAGQSPIGRRISLRAASFGQSTETVRRIVGVARQVKERPDEREDLLQVYVPITQNAIDDIYLLVRPAPGGRDGLAKTVRAAIGRVDTDQLVDVREVMTLDDVARAATARHRFRAVLVMAFAGLALVLAMAGVFGILVHSVQLRSRDFGVRRALGATTGDVLRLVVSDAARVIVAGAAIGLASALALGRLLTTVLFEVRPLDPLTLATVTATLLVTAAASTAIPAWRATRIDPAVALRGE